MALLLAVGLAGLCRWERFGDVRRRKDPWGRVESPSRGRLGPIGAYSAGCLDGAVALAMDGPGYQVMRPGRNRFYGHESLLGFIRSLAARTWKRDLGVLLIGDLAQPRGGPLASGHASHQTGLDVDVWYWLSPVARYRPLSRLERETLSAPAMVDLEHLKLNRDRWLPQNERILALAAEMPEVERIFVNPVIKQQLCRTAGRERAWLAKIRPWYGHEDHFHVRLRCPAGSLSCKAQAEPPPGDGCGSELAWWFTDEGLKAPARADTDGPPRLPAACGSVLHGI